MQTAAGTTTAWEAESVASDPNRGRRQPLPACKEPGCSCPGFDKNPLIETDCLNCHHDFLRHRRQS